MYLVMELLRGGELFDRIFAKKFFQESEAKSILETVTKVVAFLHQKGVSLGSHLLIHQPY